MRGLDEKLDHFKVYAKRWKKFPTNTEKLEISKNILYNGNVKDMFLGKFPMIIMEKTIWKPEDEEDFLTRVYNLEKFLVLEITCEKFKW